MCPATAGTVARCYPQGMPRYEISSGRRSPATRVTLLILLLLLLFGVRSFAGYAIEIEWWKELGQLNTWFSMLYYSIAPVAIATLLAFARAVGFPRARPQVRRHPAGRASPLRETFRSRSARARLVYRRRGHRQLDRGPLRRFARAARGHQRLARCGFQPAAILLSVRPSVLFAAARICAGAESSSASWSTGWRLAAGSCATACRSCAIPASSIPACSSSKAGWNRASCAAPPWSCCWPSPSSSTWAATRWSTTSTAAFWWASITWTRTSDFRCNGW